MGAFSPCGNFFGQFSFLRRLSRQIEFQWIQFDTAGKLNFPNFLPLKSTKKHNFFFVPTICENRADHHIKLFWARNNFPPPPPPDASSEAGAAQYAVIVILLVCAAILICLSALFYDGLFQREGKQQFYTN